jgi:hypothetical protein
MGTKMIVYPLSDGERWLIRVAAKVILAVLYALLWACYGWPMFL